MTGSTRAVLRTRLQACPDGTYTGPRWPWLTGPTGDDMTAPEPTCLRGCTRPCHADECTATGEHNHPALGQHAAVGLLCARCAGKLHHWIVSTPDLYAQLSTDMQSRPESTGERHTKISGSPSLIRLEVLALLDPRTNTGPSKPGPTGIVEPDDGLVNVAQALTSWAALFMEEQNLQATVVDTITSAVNVLTVWFTTVAAQPWVDELYTEMQNIHRLLAVATNQPKPIGRCFGRIVNKPCNKPLYPSLDGGPVVCSDPGCAREYSGLGLVRLQIQTEREGAA